jgi:hypothetical protein
MGSKRKGLKELNMENKKDVLDLIDNGVSQPTIAAQFGVAKSTVGNINKNTDAILKASKEHCSSERKRKLRRTDNENVNAVTLQSFLKCLGVNNPVTGPIPQAKPRETAHRLHVENFQASNGCLESFRT